MKTGRKTTFWGQLYPFRLKQTKKPLLKLQKLINCQPNLSQFHHNQKLLNPLMNFHLTFLLQNLLLLRFRVNPKQNLKWIHSRVLTFSPNHQRKKKMRRKKQTSTTFLHFSDIVSYFIHSSNSNKNIKIIIKSILEWPFLQVSLCFHEWQLRTL
jgi:hypothetical protein